MNENESQSSVEEMLKKASQKLGTDPQNLRKSMANGNLNNLLKSIGTNEAQKIEQILSNKEAATKLLSTPKAQQLLKKLLGEK